jgi:hypothetical protein
MERPILHLFSFNLPMKWADLSEKATLHCAFSMRNGVNLHRNEPLRVVFYGIT